MKNSKLLLIILIVIIFSTTGCYKNENQEYKQLDPNNPVTIKIWHYYNGKQQEIFNKEVAEFNETEGKKAGINVEVTYMGSTNEIQQAVLDSANKKVGADEIPNIFSAYSDNAYAIDKLGLIEDLSSYLSKEEKSEFVQDYIEAGYKVDGKKFKILPVARSTEVMALNKTDWNKFAAATGVGIDKLSTIEGVSEVAKIYYNWTDGLTPQISNDGKAFFGRDALANLFFIGFKQFDKELFRINEDGKVEFNFDRDIVRKIWDNYYVPMVKGYFCSDNKFRSDNMKIGEIIAFVGSSSSVNYISNEVVVSDTQSYPIEIGLYEAPKFNEGKNCAIQQGAGMVVTNKSDIETIASVKFLKWLTQTERNAAFTAEIGYFPVKKEASDLNFMSDIIEQTGVSEIQKNTLNLGIDIVNNNELYTPSAFNNASEVRQLLEKSLLEKAQNDRTELKTALDEGLNLEEAAGKYDTDENFQKWYQKIKGEIESYLE